MRCQAYYDLWKIRKLQIPTSLRVTTRKLSNRQDSPLGRASFGIAEIELEYGKQHVICDSQPNLEWNV
jgi:hypothetical protein